jgi:acyl carrier protein
MNQLNEILCQVFRLKQDQLSDELTMEDIDRWDSLTHMDLITSIEEGLGVELTMDEIMAMTDIQTIRNIVLRSN